MPPTIEPHTFSLLPDGSARLTVDYWQGVFRVAFYFPVKGQREDKRYANSKPKLYDAIEECYRVNGSPFAGEVYDKAHETERYIRATSWGSLLP